MISVERATGVEPASKAWEAFILPMNYARKSARLWQAQDVSIARPAANVELPVFIGEVQRWLMGAL